jgi:hypothetical protein
MVFLAAESFKHAHLIGIIYFTGIDKFHLIPLADTAIKNSENYFNTSIGIKNRIKNHGLKGCSGSPLGDWNFIEQ